MICLDKFVIFCLPAIFLALVIFGNCEDVQYYDKYELEHFMANVQKNKDFFKAAEVPPDTTTVDLISKNGYPVETHHIQTADGYILTAHRIPHGRNWKSALFSRKQSPYPPVYLLHGNFQSSADWVLNSQLDNCLGFILADAGFDVWLGNARGNLYSNKHMNLNTNQPAYWNYSMDEYGKYDIPATVEYILETTGKSKIHYVGFSLGNTHFYLALARYPQLSHKIALHISYAPFVFFDDFPILQGGLFAPFVGLLQLVQDLTGGIPVPPGGISFFLSKFLPLVCNPKLDIIGLCRFITFLIAGFGPNQISREQIPSILGHLLTSTSLKGLIHTLQLMNNKKFTPYDYGPSGNYKEYGQSTVPEYTLNKFSTPVVLVRAPNDIFVHKKVTDKLAHRLANLIEYHVVPNEEFTHLDFVYGSDANVLVYNHTVGLLQAFS